MSNLSTDVKAYFVIIGEALFHINQVSVLDKLTGEVVTRIPANQFTDKEEALYSSPQFIIVR